MAMSSGSGCLSRPGCVEFVGGCFARERPIAAPKRAGPIFRIALPSLPGCGGAISGLVAIEDGLAVRPRPRFVGCGFAEGPGGAGCGVLTFGLLHLLSQERI